MAKKSKYQDVKDRFARLDSSEKMRFMATAVRDAARHYLKEVDVDATKAKKSLDKALSNIRAGVSSELTKARAAAKKKKASGKED